MAHRTVARRAEHADEVKGSRFLGVVAPIQDLARAEALVAELRRAHPGASHHCLAARVGAEMRFDDDGEPGGTAGRPMLEVLLKRDLDRVAAVVVRTFGGTKLGAGGLVRAYTAAVSRACDAAGVREVPDLTTVTVRAPFARLDEVHRLLAGWPELAAGAPHYDADGARISVRLRADARAELARALADATRGDAAVEDAPGA